MKSTRFRWSRAALLAAPVALAASALAAQSASPAAPTAPPTPPAPRTPPAAVDRSPYAADPNDLWNRLHRGLFVNDTTTRGLPNHLTDPLLLAPMDYLLNGDSHRTAVALLDEFLADTRAQAGRQAIHRLFLQHDLWAAFDHAARWTNAEKDELAAIALRTRLARAIKILALSDRELTALPDNYAQAVKTGRFAKAFDAAKPDRPFLPEDLFDPAGPWVAIGLHFILAAPMAERHFDGSGGRAVHIVLLNLPGGRAVTEKFLADLKPPLKNFPAGTMTALVRRTLTIDQHGNLRVHPSTESVQFRVYLEVPDVMPLKPGDIFPHPPEGGRQSFFEFVLNRTELSRGNDGLRSVGQDEPDFVFSRTLRGRSPTQMNSCIGCHGASGIYSMQSMTRQQRGINLLVELSGPAIRPSSLEVQANSSISTKSKQFDWGLLQGILEGQGAGQ